MLLNAPVASPTGVPSRAPLSRELWARHIHNQFEDHWPRPRCATAMPSDWSVLAHARTVTHFTTAVTLLAHRDGGVHVVYRNIRCGETCNVAYGGQCVRLGFVYVSLVDMHRELTGLDSRNPGGLEHSAPLEAATAAVVALYDPTDPVEAAEATLVALGGAVRVYPRCLA